MSTKKYLNQFTKEQLIEQIIDLASKYKDVKAYYNFHQKPNSDELKEKYIKQIHKAIMGSRNLEIKKIKTIITTFTNLSPNPEALIEVILYFVSTASKHLDQYGHLNKPFYPAMATYYRQAANLINEWGLHKQFETTAYEAIELLYDYAPQLFDSLNDIYINWIDINRETEEEG